MEGKDACCSDRYHVYSTDDPVHRTDHDVFFQYRTSTGSTMIPGELRAVCPRLRLSERNRLPLLLHPRRPLRCCAQSSRTDPHLALRPPAPGSPTRRRCFPCRPLCTRHIRVDRRYRQYSPINGRHIVALRMGRDSIQPLWMRLPFKNDPIHADDTAGYGLRFGLCVVELRLFAIGDAVFSTGCER